MTIAYLISAHTDAPQLRRLIASLHSDAHFFVHIDKKSNISDFTQTICGENIHFLTNRINVRWGTINEVYYQLELLKEAVEYKQHFDKIVFLSGMDYPLWSNDSITNYLEQNSNTEIIQGICIDTPEIGEIQHETYSTIRPFINLPFLNNSLNTKLSIISRILLRLLGLRKPLHFKVGNVIWKLYKGSAWWCISEELGAFILKQYTSHPEIKRYFKNQFGAAETLIQTIVFNSPYKKKALLSTGKYKSLKELTPLHHIDYNPVIRVWDENGFDELTDSRKMFARKFVSGKSDKVVELIEQHRHNQHA